MTATSLVQVKAVEPGVVRLTLNRPEQRNALSIALMEELCRAVQTIEKDASARVLILAGAGLSFCAGLDLKEAARDLELAEKGAQRVARVLKTIHQSRLVTIAAIHGAVMAGGAGLMSACDLVVAAQDTRIGYPEVRRGLVAGLVLHFLLRQVGDRMARQLLLTGESIMADEAARIGLINQVVPVDTQLTAALELARQVLKGAPQAIARTRQLIEELGPRDLNDDLQRALEHHMAARRSDEAKEGMAAFAQKREPVWHP
ncbi:MAG: enoyl-CoA hydratase-related protein [Phycisphaeraceae bacterium]